MGVEVMTALAIAAASAGASAYNTKRTEKKQDSALATSLRNKAASQREADAKVGDEVTRLQGSRAEDSRRKALEQYMDTLRQNKGSAESGLTPAIGGEAFAADSAGAAQGVQDYAQRSADLMSKVDAAGMQRQTEGASYGHLGTDLNLIKRSSSRKLSPSGMTYSAPATRGGASWLNAYGAGP
jgi:hypothetical protein